MIEMSTTANVLELGVVHHIVPIAMETGIGAMRAAVMVVATVVMPKETGLMGMGIQAEVQGTSQ